MKNNPVAKNAHKFNKASVQKDRKKALKKGDRKHKGRYEDSGDIEERSTLDAISSVLTRGKDKSKYQAAVKAVKSGKYTLSKAAQVFGVRDKVLQDLVAEGNMKENGKGLWANIRAKRARGEKPAKPGDKDYPKTLEIEGKNTPGDGNPCWDTHKKVGTKMKNGKRVNDCVPKNEGTSAQSRLDRAMSKRGLGKPNTAASDYEAKLMKKYGAKDMADLKKKMSMKEQVVSELTKKDLERIANRKKKNLIKRGKLKPEPKKPRQAGAGRVSNVGAGKEEAADNVIMQLRKSQDLKGRHDIKFRGGEIKLPINLVNKLLDRFDKIQKPADKKKFVTMVTHELRKKAGLKDKPKATSSDKAMDKFNKSRKRGISVPRGKGSGPSDKELQDIDRGK
jgi:hypothetical protein